MGESNAFLSLTILKIKKNQSIIIFLRYLKFLNKKNIFIQKMLIKFLKVFILIAKEIVIKTGIYENIALIRSSY